MARRDFGAFVPVVPGFPRKLCKSHRALTIECLYPVLPAHFIRRGNIRQYEVPDYGQFSIMALSMPIKLFARGQWLVAILYCKILELINWLLMWLPA